MANMTNNIEVDPALLDLTDSDYAISGYETGNTSLSSTVNGYIFENGRRYHAYYGTDKSLMPTDEEEQDRLDLAHEILLQLLNGEFHKAPIMSKPERILDVGTGTGIWAIDMADKYPSAEVIGLDLSPIQSNWIPPNCKFEVDDAELEWTYPSDSFDFIHFRSVAQGITKWSQVLGDAYRCTKSGGYIELSEPITYFQSDDGSLKEDNPLAQWSNLMKEALSASGRDHPSEQLLRQRLEKAGFVDVQAFTLLVPVGPWAKDKSLKKLGVMLQLHAEQGFHSYGMLAFTKILGMDPNEADKLCRATIAATKDKSLHSYGSHCIAFGRKPQE